MLFDKKIGENEREVKNWYILIQELNVIHQPDREKQMVWSLHIKINRYIKNR